MYPRNQANRAKEALILKGMLADAVRKITRFSGLIREEVYTYAYTSLEKAFGEQPEAVLLGIDRGVKEDIKPLDDKLIRSFRREFDGRPVVTHVMELMGGDVDPNHEDLNFVRVLRDEVVDLVAQRARDAGIMDHAAAEVWANALINEAPMAPAQLVKDAQARMPKPQGRKAG